MSIAASMLPALLGRPVAYQAVFTSLPGVSVQGAIFLSQALFLTNTPTAQKRGGWFWKEQQGPEDSWESETGMSAKSQVTARRQLTEIGVLEEIRKGVPAKTWYRVNTDILAEQLAKALGSEEPQRPDEEQSPPPGEAEESQILPSVESENSEGENQESPNGSVQNLPNVDFSQRLQQRETSLSQDTCDQSDDEHEHPIFRQRPDDNEKISSKRNTPAVINERFSMHRDWVPDPEQLRATFLRRGMPIDTEYTAAELDDFTAHHADKPGFEQSEATWITKFAAWVQENRARQSSRQNSKNTGGRSNDQRSNGSQNRYDPAAARARDEALRHGGSGNVYDA